MLWSLVTELREEQQGPAVVLQPGGAARKVCRQTGAAVIANGIGVPGHTDYMNRLFAIIKGLTKRVGELQYEINQLKKKLKDGGEETTSRGITDRARIKTWVGEDEVMIQIG